MCEPGLTYSNSTVKTLVARKDGPDFEGERLPGRNTMVHVVELTPA